MLSILAKNEACHIRGVVKELVPKILGKDVESSRQAAEAVARLGRTAVFSLVRNMQVGPRAQRVKNAQALARVAPWLRGQEFLNEVFMNAEIAIPTPSSASDLVLASRAVEHGLGFQMRYLDPRTPPPHEVDGT
jgi:hypothetical protein